MLGIQRNSKAVLLLLCLFPLLQDHHSASEACEIEKPRALNTAYLFAKFRDCLNKMLVHACRARAQCLDIMVTQEMFGMQLSWKPFRGMSSF